MTAPTTIPTWADGAGATVVGSLTVTAVNWQSSVSSGGSITRYQFSGSPGLGSVVAGHEIQVSGCANSVHDGTLRVIGVNNTAKWVDAYNPDVTSSGTDETGSSGAAAILAGAARIKEPSASKKALGARSPEKPSDGHLNWILYWVCQWIYFFANGGAKAIQTIKTSVGRSTIATSTPTALGGEGYTVCPAKSTTAFGATVSSSTAVDIAGSTINPLVTASNRILVGASLSADYAGTTNGRVVLALEGSALSNDHEFYLPQENAAVSVFNLTASATAGTRDYATMAYESGGTANVIATNGRTWACEFSASAAAGVAVRNSTTSTTSTSFVDMTDLSITISPTNNPVLLLGKYNSNPGGASFTHAARFTDGTNNYGEWQHRYSMGSSAAHGCAIAWLTGDLNGSQTFKMQQRSITGDSVSFSAANFIAIEITGDAKSAKPTGTCSAADAEATITDGSTPLSHAFTPGAAINYLAALTCYSERTAGTGFLTLRIKVNGTEIIKVDHARDSASNYKSPITIAVPTGLLAGGVAQTIVATAETSDGSTTYDLKNCALFLVEAPALTDGFSGESSSTTIESVKNGKIEVTYRGMRTCSADDDLTLGLYKSEDGGAFSLLADSVITNPTPGTTAREVFYHHITDDIAEGTDVELELRASMATGSVVFEAGLMTAKELPSL